ncbi:uncharacterized protein LOC106086500 [Stomoxys calcitrans]|uniref:uncharacterized protein LOC106086500 n=1 Tax=Stomoxys calcitrans TaxID=35570 RepID=UPI0027E25634|nr:uncharacterized protein LOC106086500 [Stomoxys calcitrans]
MLYKIVFTLMVLSCLDNVLLAKKRRNIIFHNVTCICLTDLVKQSACDIRQLTNGRYGLNAMFELTHQLPATADVEILLTYKLPRGSRVVKFINLKLRICDVLVHLPTVPLVKEVLIGLSRYSNLPLSCPVKENKMYNVTNLIISDSVWPPYMPLVNFNFTLNFTNLKKLLYTYDLRGSVVQI